MDNRPIEDSKNERVRKKAGMYISLFICIAALILGFWSAVNRTAKLSSQATTLNRQAIVTTEQVKAVEQNQTKVQATADDDDNKNSGNDAQKKTASSEISATASFFVMPVGGEVTKQYSASELQYSKTYKDWRLHLGIDITAKVGTQVHTAGNGKVLDIYEDKDLGNVVKIDHGNNIVAFYCGVNSPTVKKGQIIEAGTTIGSIGEVPSESVEANHLHFAVKVKNEWTNPVESLKITDY